MEINSLFGLPAHPLVVHAAVVLVPLAAAGTVVIALSSRARRRFGSVVVALGIAAFAFTLLAESSGEPLEERLAESELVEAHAELGEAMAWFALPIAVSAAGLVVLDRRPGDERSGTGRPLMLVVATVAVLASAIGTVRIVQVGHSGARATWQEVQDNPKP